MLYMQVQIAEGTCRGYLTVTKELVTNKGRLTDGFENIAKYKGYVDSMLGPGAGNKFQIKGKNNNPIEIRYHLLNFF